ncbi:MULTISPECIES: hypothetical protein [unclassified Herbaspirillum]|uniref:hypothetical protein n=1 Tax=unclassified Herbaspirillum TaxID=2624150 RepID=UPI001313FA53|nr:MULTISPECIES: hypothetical protein [unclassified Herbaspirillum]
MPAIPCGNCAGNRLIVYWATTDGIGEKKPAGHQSGGFNLKNFFQEVIEETASL